MDFDAIIVGGGPAGASCGLWLKQLGFKPLIVEARPVLGGSQNDSAYRNSWVVGLGDVSGEAFAARIDAHVRAHDIALATSSRVEAVAREDEWFAVSGQGPSGRFSYHGPFVVAATGVVPERGGLADTPRIHFGPGPAIHEVAPGSRVALLGGGDNAFENYGFARAAGADVTVFARTVRARPALIAGVDRDDVREGSYEVAADAQAVEGEAFDDIFVFYGWRAETPYLDGLPVGRGARGYINTDPATAETDVAGLYAAGEIAARAHPCCVTAMADGVVVAKAIERAIG